MWRKFSVGMVIASGLLPVLTLLQPMSASALTVSPLLIEYDIDPGSAVVGSVKLFNETNSTETFYPSAQDFVAGDQGGTPAFVGTASTRSMVDWVSFQQSSITLQPGETTYAVYNISVPKNALPGGYSGGLLFSTAQPNVTEGVGAAGATGPLVLLRVGGDVMERGSVKDFSVTTESGSSLPVDFSVLFQNDGNVYVKPAGVIRITNMFGGTAAVIPVNEDGGNVLPNSSRSFSASWQKTELPDTASELVKEWKNFGFGPYTATLIMNYGESNQVVTSTASFWVMPWMLVVLFVILLVVLALLVMQYNKWLVARAMKMRK